MCEVMPDHVNGIPPINQKQIHDLKNRLTVVKGLAQLLDRQARRDDWHREKMVRRIDQLQVEILALEEAHTRC